VVWHVVKEYAKKVGVAHARSCAIPLGENWRKSNFFSDTLLCRRPNVISVASSESVEPSTTASALNRKRGCPEFARDGEPSTWICKRCAVRQDLAARGQALEPRERPPSGPNSTPSKGLLSSCAHSE